jgi:hypothetical protein
MISPIRRPTKVGPVNSQFGKVIVTLVSISDSTYGIRPPFRAPRGATERPVSHPCSRPALKAASAIWLVRRGRPFDTGADFSFTSCVPDADVFFVKEPRVIEQKAPLTLLVEQRAAGRARSGCRRR